MNEDDAPEFDPDETSDFEDRVAARVSAYTRLLALVAGLKDKELRKEGMMMLGATRRSFRTLPTGELTAITGGKDASDSSDM